MSKTPAKRRFRSNSRNRRLNLETLEPRLALTGAGFSVADLAARSIGTTPIFSNPALRTTSTDVNSVPDAVGTVTSGASVSTASAAPFSLANTFLLHSDPGAHQVIYLDFDGNVTTGTSWNSGYTGGAPIVTPAFDFDGNTSSFSDDELSQIQRMWQRVSEDFIPFNVDVTTQDPGVAALSKTDAQDTDWGVRVCVGGSFSDWLGNPAGGIAYIGSFNDAIDTPCFVFSDSLYDNEKYTAEAISHESGHTLGLWHDGLTSPSTEYYRGSGSGPTGWAPIMGNSYYENLTQWSKGEYANANNTQDDLAVITTNNGFGYRADDFGNTIATAAPLGSAATTITASGIIERSTDVDVFSFSTAGGDFGIEVSPAERGPDLDILAKLYDANGTLVASSNPADALDASFQANLPAGTYYLSIDGTGKGNPLTGGYSDYDSLGQYTITAGPNTAPIASAGSSASGTEDTPVTFDASASFDADGNSLTYNWDFGDGTTSTTTSPTIAHTYLWGATFPVTLTVNDGHGGTSTSATSAAVSEVNDTPAANAGGPYSGMKGVAVAFSAAGSSDYDNLDGTAANDQALTCSWNFGDGTTGTGVSPSHVYATAGNYTATVTVSDGSASTSAATSVSIVAPSANNMYVWDIAAATTKKGPNTSTSISVTVRRDSNTNGLADSNDALVQSATLTVELRSSNGNVIGAVSGTTSKQGVFSGSFSNLANGTYVAEVTVLSHGTYTWSKVLDPTPNDTDLDGDNLPDQQFTVGGAAAATALVSSSTQTNAAATTSAASQSDTAGPTSPPRLIPAAVDQLLLPPTDTTPHHARHATSDAADEAALDELFALI